MFLGSLLIVATPYSVVHPACASIQITNKYTYARSVNPVQQQTHLPYHASDHALSCRSFSSILTSNLPQKSPVISASFAENDLQLKASCDPTLSCIPRLEGTEWQRPRGCLKLQVIFRKKCPNYRALLRKMTYKDKASYGSRDPVEVLQHTVEISPQQSGSSDSLQYMGTNMSGFGPNMTRHDSFICDMTH